MGTGQHDATPFLGRGSHYPETTVYLDRLSIRESIFFCIIQTIQLLGGSPGLVVMGGDSCTKGCGFKSCHCILDGHISQIFVVKIVMMFV